MKAIRASRQQRRLSQRALAQKAGVSFKGLQLMERAHHNARLSSLRKVAAALGLPEGGPDTTLDHFFSQPPEGILAASLRIAIDGFESWPIHLFNFVDALRASPDPAFVTAAPFDGLDERIGALIAATVETLCRETSLVPPAWCRAIGPLKHPWFVSGVENLKATALVESPASFRARNIFVLGNFLDRA